MSVAAFYQGWELANQALIDAIAPLTAEQLATEVYPKAPIWGSVSHLAGTRVFWLCHIFKEPGMETTPFTDPDRGWEDDPSHPRSAAELVGALRSTWKIVDHALNTWTPESLTQTARRPLPGRVQIHTRQSVLWRMITHDAFHIGEISAAMGTHQIGPNAGNGPIDLWAGLSRVEAT